jgi:hypothetical protein
MKMRKLAQIIQKRKRWKGMWINNAATKELPFQESAGKKKTQESLRFLGFL